VLYCIAETANTEAKFVKNGRCTKRGGMNGEGRGAVFQTYEQARECCPLGYSIYGVDADWEKDACRWVGGSKHKYLNRPCQMRRLRPGSTAAMPRVVPNEVRVPSQEPALPVS